ncbi:FimB/Mfa2 family fimbrial subunit [Danxiaibacter flavus]|uniref:FimB/Mfa2 family fimbrial subunit n=1 Tax=Danxiaibacter flavus TaxID=3049108 RepID=A0ABV3Z9T2_9BACT|nr:FimB/Mfa2 family fimbrial subunit [Chitinophagaceae bacterium DXS]
MRLTSIVPLVFLSLIFNSCSKNAGIDQQPVDQIPDLSKTHSVAFDFSNFKVSYNERASNKEVAAKDYLSIISIIAFDSAGNHANSVVQSTYGGNTSGFDAISLPLKAGTYTFLVEGTAKENQQLFTDFSELSTTRLMTSLSHDDRHGSDVFYNKFVLTVGDRDTTINTLRLERLTGLLEIQFTDTLPENVERVDVKLYDAPFSYYVAEDSVKGRDSMFVGQIARNTNIDSLKVSNFFFGTNTPVTVVIKTYDKNGNFMFEKRVDNIFVYRNKKTILKGKLYPTNLSVGMPVTVDPDFAEIINQSF